MALVQQVQNGTLVDETGSPLGDKSSKKTAKSNELGYDQFLQILCAEMQYQDPLEPTSNTEYVAQLATFSQLESTLSMQNTVESSSANDLVGKYVIMKVTSSTTGETNYIAGICDYVLHQNGETYLSVNDGLYSLSDLDTVADVDYMEALTLSQTLRSAILALPSKNSVTLSDKEEIQEIRKIYDEMTDYQKNFVDKDLWKKFEEIEERLSELLETEGGETEKPEGGGTEKPEGGETEKPEDKENAQTAK